MKVLLDTHAFIWWDSDPTKLSSQARAACEDLAPYHRDPFDRLLITQANVEEAILISHDPVFSHYAVKVLW